jgi:metalloendopeptidase OMA1, mitochondrial
MNNNRWSYWFILTAFVAGCATVPYTNRRKLDLISEGQEMQLGDEAFADVKKKNKVSTDAGANEMVKRVGQRIAAVADKPNYKWEFIVIDDPKTPNAFCLPGGKVAVYTGLLPITKDENGLAVVMSHEVAHALAGHGAERMSEGMLVGLVGAGAAVTGVIKTEQQMQAVQMAYGVGRGLPHGRKQETEADRIGLILMAKAGYDPNGAVGFWERMRDASGGGKPPEWLSTHPSDETRIKNIKNEFVPEAMRYYKPQ